MPPEEECEHDMFVIIRWKGRQLMAKKERQVQPEGRKGLFEQAKDGKVIADDVTKVRFSLRDVAIEPDTGKPVAHQVIYEYTEGRERYVLTFTREKDTLHYKFIEELHGIKALLARLIPVDGAYLRFTGELSFAHYQADQLVETHRDEALWELMYFGHVRQK
jgi:hypothetical protein